MNGEQQASAREERAAAVEAVRHSTELEGRQSSPAARELQDRYVAGEVDVDELRRRTQALYGLPPQPGDSDYPAAGSVDRDENDRLVMGLVDQVLADSMIELAMPTLAPTAEQMDRYAAFLEEINHDPDRERKLAIYRKHYPENPEPAP